VGQTLRLRWLIWLLPALIYATSHIHRIAPTVIFNDLMATFQTSGASLGGLGSMYFYIYAIMQIPSGILADSLGPRKTICAGAIIGGLGSVLFGSAQTIGVAYLGRFFIGLGMSLIFICIMKLLAEWFCDHEFATMSGLTLFSGNLGAVAATTPLYLLVAATGWRRSYHFIGLITLLFGVLAWLIVRDRPALSGFLPVKDREGRGGMPGIQAPAHEKMNVLQGLREALSNRAIWPTFLISFGLYGTILALKGMWLTPYLTQVYGISQEQATSYVLLSLIAGLIGPLMMGFFSDRIRRRRLPILMFTPLYVLTWLVLALWQGGRPPLVTIPYLLFALGIFCSPMALTWACAKEVSHPSLVGLATGIANIGGFLGGAVMQFVFGYILDLKWQGAVVDGLRIYPVQAYQAAFLSASFVALIAAVSSYFIRETCCKNIYVSPTLTPESITVCSDEM
jgi:sugar phosphate permease